MFIARDRQTDEKIVRQTDKEKDEPRNKQTRRQSNRRME